MAAAPAANELGFRPLYQQVRDRLVRRIADGTWRNGEMVPSEMQIAAELGVSQGTVRKALDDMTAAKLLVRRQGRGTFVSSHDEARILFQFFKLQPDKGPRVFPESEVLGVTEGVATEEEAMRLAIYLGEAVIRIRRVRSLAGQRCILETVSVPATLFEGLGIQDIPNNLYDLYAREFGVTVSGGREEIKAVAADAETAAALRVPLGHPLLKVDRTALSIEGKPIEWRVSLCETSAMKHVSELS